MKLAIIPLLVGCVFPLFASEPKTTANFSGLWASDRLTNFTTNQSCTLAPFTIQQTAQHLFIGKRTYTCGKRIITRPFHSYLINNNILYNDLNQIKEGTIESNGKEIVLFSNGSMPQLKFHTLDINAMATTTGMGEATFGDDGLVVMGGQITPH